MIVQTPNCSFMLDNVQGFYIETDIDYNHQLRNMI